MDFEDKSRALIPLLEKAAKKNVKVRLALSGSSDSIKKFAAKHAFKVKQIESKARIFMSDRKEILFMITPLNSEEEIGIWLNSSYFTDSLTEVLENALKNQISDN